MRRLRLRLCMKIPDFGNIVKLKAHDVKNREDGLAPWREHELQTAFAALIIHLKENIQQVEALALKFSPPSNPKSL